MPPTRGNFKKRRRNRRRNRNAYRYDARQLEVTSRSLHPAAVVGDQYATTSKSPRYAKPGHLEERQKHLHKTVSTKTLHKRAVTKPREVERHSKYNSPSGNKISKKHYEKSRKENYNTQFKNDDINPSTDAEDVDFSELCIVDEYSNSSYSLEDGDSGDENLLKASSGKNLEITSGTFSKQITKKSLDPGIGDAMMSGHSTSIRNQAVLNTEPLTKSINRKQHQKTDLNNKKTENRQSSLKENEHGKHTKDVNTSAKRSLAIERVMEDLRKKIKIELGEGTAQNILKTSVNNFSVRESPARANTNKLSLPLLEGNSNEQITEHASKKIKVEAVDVHNVNEATDSSYNHAYMVKKSGHEARPNNQIDERITRKEDTEKQPLTSNYWKRTPPLSNNIKRSSLQTETEVQGMIINDQNNPTAPTLKSNSHISDSNSQCLSPTVGRQLTFLSQPLRSTPSMNSAKFGILAKEAGPDSCELRIYLDLNVKLKFDDLNEVYKYVDTVNNNCDSFRSIFYRNASTVPQERISGNVSHATNQKNKGNIHAREISSKSARKPKEDSTNRRHIVSPRKNQDGNGSCFPEVAKATSRALYAKPFALLKETDTNFTSINTPANLQINVNELNKIVSSVYDLQVSKPSGSLQTATNEPTSLGSTTFAKILEMPISSSPSAMQNISSRIHQMPMSTPPSAVQNITSGIHQMPMSTSPSASQNISSGIHQMPMSTSPSAMQNISSRIHQMPMSTPPSAVQNISSGIHQMPVSTPPSAMQNISSGIHQISMSTPPSAMQNVSTSITFGTEAFQHSNNENILNIINTKYLKSLLENISASDSRQREMDSDLKRTGAISKQKDKLVKKKMRRNSITSAEDTETKAGNYSNNLNTYWEEMNKCLNGFPQEKLSLPRDTVHMPRNPPPYKLIPLSDFTNNLDSSVSNNEYVNIEQRQEVQFEQLPDNNNSVPYNSWSRRQLNSTPSNVHPDERIDAASRPESVPVITGMGRNPDNTAQNTLDTMGQLCNYNTNYGSRRERGSYPTSSPQESFSSEIVNKPMDPQSYWPNPSPEFNNLHHPTSKTKNLNIEQSHEVPSQELPGDDVSFAHDPRLRKRSINTKSNIKSGFVSNYSSSILQENQAVRQSEQLPLHHTTTTTTTSYAQPSSSHNLHETSHPHQVSQSISPLQSSHFVSTECIRVQQPEVTDPASAPMLNSPSKSNGTFATSSHLGQQPLPPSSALLPQRTNQNPILENLRKAIGRKIIQTSDVMFFIISWNADWLMTQSNTMLPPRISEKHFVVRDNYKSFEEYYNTYLPLHLLNIWYNIYESWRANSHFYTCTMEMQDEKLHYVRCTCITVVEKYNRSNCPKRDDIILITLINKGQPEIMFGYIVSVEQSSYNRSEALADRKIKLVFFTTATLNSSEFRIQKLVNIRISLKQIEALQAIKLSEMKPIILKPVKCSSRIKGVQLDTRQQKLPKYLEQLQSIETDIALIEITPKSFSASVSTILKIVEITLKRNSVVMICVKNREKFLQLSRNLVKYNLVIAVKLSEVSVPEELKMHTLPDQVDINANTALEQTNFEMLRKCQIVLTMMNNIYLDNIGDAWWDWNLTCVIDDAQLCTETETILPLLYNVKKFVLIGNSTDNAAVSDFLRTCDFHRSLYSRFSKACFHKK